MKLHNTNAKPTRKPRNISRAHKNFGKVRLMKQHSVYHGFKVKPGMFYGQDKHGYFVTWGTFYKGKLSVWRMNPKDEKQEWKRTLEPKYFDLPIQINAIEPKVKKEQQYLIAQEDAKLNDPAYWEHMDKKRIREELDKFEAPEEIGLGVSEFNPAIKIVGRLNKPVYPKAYDMNPDYHGAGWYSHMYNGIEPPLDIPTPDVYDLSYH